MTYEEFEWNILKLAYEDGLEHFKPSFVAYALGLPHETVSNYLEQATHAGLLEMEVTDDGRLEYFIPGVDKDAELPRPVWKDEFDALDAHARADEPGGAAEATAGADSDGSVAHEQPPRDDRVDHLPHDGFVSADSASAAAGESDGQPDGALGGAPRRGRAEAQRTGGEPAGGEPTDGALDRPGPPTRHRPPRSGDGRPSATEQGADAAPSRAIAKTNRSGSNQSIATQKGRALTVRAPHRSQLPAALRAHIEQRYGSEDGSVTALSRTGAVAVIDREATVNDADEVVVEGQLVKADDDRLPLRIEPGDDTFTDPSQTIFMRQLKVYGVDSEETLREHVERLFTSFGYQAVHVGGERMRFERGSVTFILALVPLFVLVLPLFVYLFLYCMGRSTIQQEPVELDVQFRKLAGDEGTYEIDLTFIGMHGVVLGAADQRVLNQEVDTLRDELQWSLSTA